MTYFTLEGGPGWQENIALVRLLFDAFDAGDLATRGRNGGRRLRARRRCREEGPFRGAASSLWPTASLCRDCHGAWHRGLERHYSFKAPQLFQREA